jgi:hypothetical protein
MNQTVTRFEARRLAQREMLDLVDRLVADFGSRHAAGTVIRCVASARETLLRAGVRDDLTGATERVVRRRLDDRMSA